MKNIVKFITKVEMTTSDNVASWRILQQGKALVDIVGNMTELCCQGLSQLEISEKTDNKERIRTAKLTSTILDDISIGNKKLVFRLTDTQGKKLILGSDERPFPIVSISEVLSGSAQSTSKKTMTVTLSSINPITEIGL